MNSRYNLLQYFILKERFNMEERAFLILNNIKKKAQLEAVREDGYNIQYIDNPSKQVQLEPH